VEVFVCGRALASWGFKRAGAAEGIKVASAALAFVINK